MRVAIIGAVLLGAASGVAAWGGVRVTSVLPLPHWYQSNYQAGYDDCQKTIAQHFDNATTQQQLDTWLAQSFDTIHAYYNGHPQWEEAFVKGFTDCQQDYETWRKDAVN